MKKLLYVLAGIALISMPMTAFAGVAGSVHDLSGEVDQSLCFACHTPHNAQGANLWASAPGGPFTGVQNLCYTCHDGSITSVGSSTAFDALKEQHKTVGDDCSGDGACHDVHNQNPNGTGRFLVETRTNNSYCETCHDATRFTGAEALGDHTTGITHFTNGTTFTCNQCHTVHGATAQTTNPAGLTNPILLADNEPGTFYGAFCISCHNGTAPAVAAEGTGGVAATDVWDYSESATDGTQTKHTTTAATGDHGFTIGGCDLCHDVHDPAGTDFGYLLKADNTNSAYCVSCHDGVDGQDVGANTHYVGIPGDVNMNSGLTPALPWANQIDEDGTGGADWATATANNMVCETCHSVHKQGNTGLDAQYFLRHENGAANQICSACHKLN